MKDLKTIKKEASAKFQELKWKVEYNSRRVYCWVEEHPDLVIASIPVALAVIKGTTKVVDKVDHNVRLKKEQELKDLYIYDRSLGTYLKMNRIPSANDYLEIEQRKRNGEALTVILRNMKLI